MKKILNGLRYDTDKAVEIGSASGGGESTRDFEHWEATLYRTPRSGRFFLAGEGGPMSRFSQSIGQNSWSGGSDLIPMTREEALVWAEQHLNTEEIELHFPNNIKDA